MTTTACLPFHASYERLYGIAAGQLPADQHRFKFAQGLPIQTLQSRVWKAGQGLAFFEH